MELNNPQIRRLFDYVGYCDIDYIDVQHEIVDHLATEIETQINTNNDLDFEDVLDDVQHKYFFQMKEMIQSKEQSIRESWATKLFSFYKSYFGFQHILVTAFMYLAIVLGTLIIGSSVLKSAIVICAILSLSNLSSYKKYNSKSSKKYLTTKVFYQNTMNILITAISFSPAFILLINSPHSIFFQGWPLYLLGFIILTILLWNHACLSVFPRFLDEEINSKYPYIKLIN